MGNYSGRFINSCLPFLSVIHFKTSIKLLKNDRFKKIDMADLDYNTWFVVANKNTDFQTPPMRWFPEDRYFRMTRWKCLTQIKGYRGLVEVYPP